MKFYAGFPAFDTLHTAFSVTLESDAKAMQQWEAKNVKLITVK